MILNRLHELAVEHLEAGRLDEAEACCRKVLAIDPGHAKALANLGVILQSKGALGEAERRYREAIAADGQLAQARFNLGALQVQLGERQGGVEHLRRALELDPSRAQWHSALGSALSGIERPLDAKASFEAALRLAPHDAGTHEELGGCLLGLGQAEAAVGEFRRAAELDPHGTAPSNMLFALNYVAGADPEAVYQEHLSWAKRQAAGLAALAHRNAPGSERKLRIGYVSPDFRNHPVAYFLEPVLACRDRSQFEVLCYSDVLPEDEHTKRLRALADGWRETASSGNEELARQIRDDEVDILVDLAGHTAGGKRMLLFARKPAPVQASWLGYLNTTGLEAIDYRITDWHACPAEWKLYHTETLVRLPNSQWCYSPPDDAPQVGPLPARGERTVTFGALQNFAKVNAAVISAWSRVLREAPSSRLLLVAPGMEQIFELIAQQFARHGVDPARIEVQGRVSVSAYLALHNRVDISLDTFPYTGGTTTCHALWMGVPVVTLSGRTVVSRGGASVLNVVGLSELVAASEEQYVEIAAGLARDLGRLERLRRELRERVAGSPLADARRFTADLETAYRAMWRGWCAGR